MTGHMMNNGPKKRRYLCKNRKINNKISRAEITPEMVRDRLAYNPDTGLFVWKISPCNRVRAGSIAGHLNRKGYIDIHLLRCFYQAHQLAWFYVYGEWAPLLDHIDGNPSNNAIGNLRKATASQNCQNQIYRGFSYSEQYKAYLSRIRVNGERVTLGKFASAEAARAAYLEAHAKFHGDFSFTNRPLGGRASTDAISPAAPSSPGERR